MPQGKTTYPFQPSSFNEDVVGTSIAHAVKLLWAALTSDDIVVPKKKGADCCRPLGGCRCRSTQELPLQEQERLSRTREAAKDMQNSDQLSNLNHQYMRCPKMSPNENDPLYHCTRMTPLGLAKTVHEFPYKNWGLQFVLGHFRMRHFCYYAAYTKTIPCDLLCLYENDTTRPCARARAHIERAYEECQFFTDTFSPLVSYLRIGFPLSSRARPALGDGGVGLRLTRAAMPRAASLYVNNTRGGISRPLGSFSYTVSFSVGAYIASIHPTFLTVLSG